MRFHQFQPGRRHAPMQVLDLHQFDARQVLNALQDSCLIHLTAGDLLVAMILGLQHQVIGRDGVPKAFIVHGLKPFFHLVNIFEFSHAPRIANAYSATQFQHGKRG